MKKEGNDLQKKERADASLLRHLVLSLAESESKLEEFYKRKDADAFNQIKKFMINLSNKISETLE